LVRHLFSSSTRPDPFLNKDPRSPRSNSFPVVAVIRPLNVVARYFFRSGGQSHGPNLPPCQFFPFQAIRAWRLTAWSPWLGFTAPLFFATFFWAPLMSPSNLRILASRADLFSARLIRYSCFVRFNSFPTQIVFAAHVLSPPAHGTPVVYGFGGRVSPPEESNLLQFVAHLSTWSNRAYFQDPLQNSPASILTCNLLRVLPFLSTPPPRRAKVVFLASLQGDEDRLRAKRLPSPGGLEFNFPILRRCIEPLLAFTGELLRQDSVHFPSVCVLGVFSSFCFTPFLSFPPPACVTLFPLLRCVESFLQPTSASWLTASAPMPRSFPTPPSLSSRLSESCRTALWRFPGMNLCV